MAIIYALLSACTYGVADYAGGRATRRLAAVLVTAAGQAVSLIGLAIYLSVADTAVPPGRELIWGAIGGACGVVGLVAFYHALSRAPVTVVAPITAVVGATLPAVVAVIRGERPGPWALIGVASALLAVALVSGWRAPRATTDAVAPRMIWLAVVAGCGFGLIFTALAETSADSGMWPLLAARCVSVPVAAVATIVTTSLAAARRSTPLRTWALVGVGGALDMTANAAFLAASRVPDASLTLVAVVSSLYPVSTVALAVTLDRERLARSQLLGLVCAVFGLVLISANA